MKNKVTNKIDNHIEPIKLVIIYPADPLGVIPGGVDTYIRGIIRWAPDEIDVSLIGITTDIKHRPTGKWITCNIGPKEFQFFAVAWEKHAGQRSTLPLSVRFIAGLAKYRPKFKADVLDFHRLEPVIFYLNGPPINLFVHQNMQILQNPNSDILWGRWPAAYYFLEKFIMSRISSVITVREDAVEWYQQRMPELGSRVKFVPTWVDPLVFDVGTEKQRTVASQNLRQEYGLAIENRIIVTVGRLDKQKDPLLLCRAFLNLYKKTQDVRLIFIGDGVLRPDIEAFIIQNKLVDKIILAGLRNAVEISDYLKGSDIFVLSSAYEGMPMCVLESLASGLPVVSTSVGEVPRVIKPGINGYMVEYGDVGGLATVMSTALDKTWNTNSVSTSISQFSAPQILSEVYENYLCIARV
ncbi:MAG: glycosyltransferase family 4 protein [Gammaproteobacteria bacterium]|jgi:glycosyltransferase involved in cell wall biosynthesis|nr:glycosyltransferase family 4 protein [Gammaproteobacteria bacterium]